MASETNRAVKLRVEEVERLRTGMGLSHQALASGAGIDVKTLTRKLKGERAFHRTVKDIATVLHVPPESLIEGYQPPAYQPTRFELGLQVAGTIGSKEQIAGLLAIMNDTVARLSALGVSVTSCNSALSITDTTRIIVCSYGLLKGKDPFWVFLAIGPSKLQEFEAAQRNGGVDLQHFDAFGEVIVSGYGEAPPYDIIEKVAEMYQTDAQRIRSTIEKDAAAVRQELKRMGDAWR